MILSAADLRQRVQSTSLRAAQLNGVRTAQSARKEELLVSVAAAKARQGLDKEVKRVVEALQSRAHERSVGTFDRLLTAILNDVLPDEGSIRLLPKFRDNTTWLDVNLEKNGELEDVLEGNGGAVTNVVSTGLRYAALMRTKNRRLMVLDEPDCWTATERVPAFIRVVAQVAESAKVQTLFVSHFAQREMYEGLVNVVKLTRGSDGHPVASVDSVKHQWENDQVPGLRGIELFNFRAHVHTYIPCFPGATALVGDSNLGKSAAIGGALKAVAYHQSDDSMIRHKCDEARVILHLEHGIRIEWSRSRKRSPTVMYRMYQGDQLLHEGRPKSLTKPPEWVEEALRITKADELDIQIGNQKSPVFLLNETASRRAQILSLGRESGHLKSLMRLYEGVRITDGETVKSGELELTRLTFNLDRMASVPELVGKLEGLSATANDLSDYLVKRERIASILARIDEATAKIAAADEELMVFIEMPEELPTLVNTEMPKALADAIARSQYLVDSIVVPALPEVPELKDVSKVKALADAIERGQSLLSQISVPEMPELPVLKDVAAIAAIGVRITSSQTKLEALESLPDLPALPELGDLTALDRSIKAISSLEALVKAAAEEATKAVAEETSARDAFESMKQELGVCPLCDSHLGAHTGVAHVH